MATLRLVPVSGQPIDVVKDETVVGRDPSCEIVVADGSVSRKHARLERRGPVWWVVDQGSANGTYLNSLRIAEQALKNGQEIRFGALAFRVDLKDDPEATVAQPIVTDDSATVMAVAGEPAAAPPPLPPPIPKAGGAPPSAAAAKERCKSASPAAAGPASPVPQMPAGPAPAKKGRSPLVWVGVGCCGCLLLVAIFFGALFGGTYYATKGAADAAHAWLGHVRAGQSAEVQAGLSESFRAQHDEQELEAITSVIARSKDATFMGRSVENERATMTGILTGGPSPQPVVVRLVKEGGAWKVDGVTLGTE